MRTEGVTISQEHGELPKTMMAVRKTQPEPGLEYVELKVPSPKSGEVLIKVAGVGTCGSDQHILDWSGFHPVSQQRLGETTSCANPGFTLGHEVSGTVIGLGSDVDQLWLDQKIVLESVMRDPDRHPEILEKYPDGWYLGLNVDGGMAPYLVVPHQSLHRAPEDLPLEYAGALEPATTGFKAARLAKGLAEFKNLPTDAQVIVFGATGMIGAAAALAGAHYGFEVTAAGRRSEALGQLTTINSEVKVATFDKLGNTPQADIVIGVVGKPAVLAAALEVLRPGGIYIEVGLYPTSLEDLTLEDAAVMTTAQNLIVRGQIIQVGAYARDEADWQFALDHIGTEPGKIDFTPLVALKSLEEYKKAISSGKTDHFFKTVLIP